MQLTDKDGNVYGWDGLEITTSSGKPKVPVINTDITIGTTAVIGGVSGRVLYNNAGVVGELDLSSIYVPTSRTLTINGVTQDLSANRTFTISTGITIGSTAIASGTVGRILFEGAGNVVQESANLLWDDTNGRITVNTITSGAAAIFKNSTNGFTIYPQSTQVQVYSDYFGAGTDKPLILGTYTNRSNQLTLFTSGNIGVNRTTDAGFKFDVNGTARINNIFYISNPSYTGNIRIESIGNNQQRIVGAYGENITWGPDNAIRINSGETYVSGSFLGSGWWMQSNGATVLGAQAAAAASALLDIRSTTRGFLPPRMTTTQKTAIATPATGLQVFDTTLNQMSYYNGTTWINI